MGAVACATFALSIWELGTRSPLRAAADLREGLSNRRTLTAGLMRFFAGSCLCVLAIWLVLAAIGDNLRRFGAFSIAIFLAALIVEHLLGEELRLLMGIRKVGPL